MENGVLSAFFDGHPVAPIRLSASSSSTGGSVGLLTYNLLSTEAPPIVFENLNITDLSPTDTSTPPFDASVPCKLGSLWRGIPNTIALAAGGAPGTGAAVMLGDDAIVPAGANHLIASSDRESRPASGESITPDLKLIMTIALRWI